MFTLPSYSSKNFSYRGQILPAHTDIFMSVSTPFTNTRHFPATFSLLKHHLPSVFNTRCFNPYNLPFKTEVLATSIGHLFEHIFLEYFCISKSDSGLNNFTVTGNTTWNWHREPPGTYRIFINSGQSDIFHLNWASRRSARLLDTLFC